MTRPILIDARRDLFTALIDYAGLFPPAGLPMAEAVAEYRSARSSSESWILGTFVVTDARLNELAGELQATMTRGEEPWAVSVILTPPYRRAPSLVRSFATEMGAAVDVVGVEARVPEAVASGDPSAAAATAASVLSPAVAAAGGGAVFLEVPSTSDPTGIRAAVGAIVAAAHEADRATGTKLRCGGEDPALVPDPESIVEFLTSCAGHGVAYKATAGLHHPVRHHDAQLGAHRHGFLNLLVASALAGRGVTAGLLGEIVREEDPAAFLVSTTGVRWRDQHVDTEAIRAMRGSAFTSYGSCSFAEPIEDLRALGTLDHLPA